MPALTMASQVVRNPHILATDMDGELVMLNAERGAYFGIGGVGTRVWEILEHPTSLEELCQTICMEFEVAEAQCRSDLPSFLGALLDNKVVLLANE